MSSTSDSSDTGFCTNGNKRGMPYALKKRRKKINISFQELTSDESKNPKEHLNKLTSIVRETYLSYLIKILSLNYKSISTNKASSGRVFSGKDIKQCAIQMEQNALQSSIVAEVYRKAMLQMVAEIQRNTERQKLHSKLCDYSQLFDDKGTQTESFSPELSKSMNKDAACNDTPTATFPLFIVNNSNTPDITDRITRSCILPTKVNHRSRQMKQSANINSNKQKTIAMASKKVVIDVDISKGNKSPVDLYQQKYTDDHGEELLFHSYSESDECADYDEIVNDIELVPVIETKYSLLEVANNGQVRPTPKQSLDERLAALNFNRSTTFALGEFSPEKANDDVDHRELPVQEDNMTPLKSQESPGLSTLDKRLAEIHGECGEHPCTSKEAGKKAMDKPKKKLVWRYEEMHYTKKLKLKLKSLSTVKRMRLESRLNELFVEESKASRKLRERPLVEDPLLEFKDRIKPWVVKHLMPYYKSGKIDSRDFFKHVARHITDSLVEINHHPDEADVIEGINLLLNA